MTLPEFPCTLVEFDSPVDSVQDFLKQWNTKRPNPNYLLVSANVLQSDEQAWSAWLRMHRNSDKGEMLARSKDVEFIRLLAGTHHIDQAFKRAGLAQGDQSAWLVYLPEGIDELENESEAIIASFDWKTSALRPSIDQRGLASLGIESLSEDLESDLLVHVVSADLGQ